MKFKYILASLILFNSAYAAPNLKATISVDGAKMICNPSMEVDNIQDYTLSYQ